MKVNSRDLQAYGRTTAPSVEEARKAQSATADQAAKVARADSSAVKVTISDEARKLAAAQAVTKPASSQKVAELKEKIARGEFKVDAQKVARKMVDALG